MAAHFLHSFFFPSLKKSSKFESKNRFKKANFLAREIKVFQQEFSPRLSFFRVGKDKVVLASGQTREEAEIYLMSDSDPTLLKIRKDFSVDVFADGDLNTGNDSIVFQAGSSEETIILGINERYSEQRKKYPRELTTKKLENVLGDDLSIYIQRRADYWIFEEKMVLHAKQETLTKTLSCLRKEDQDRKRNFESSDLLQGYSKEGKEAKRQSG